MKKYNNSKKNKLEKVSNKFDSTIRSMKKSKNIQKKLLGVFSSNYYQQINNHQKNINKIKIPIKFVKQPDKISVSTSFQNSKINNYNREINSKNYSKFFIKPTSTIPVVSMNIPASKQDFIIPTDNLNESTKNNSSNSNTSLVSTNELNKKNVYNNSYSQYAQQFTNPYQFSYQNNSPYAFAPNSFDQSYENQQMLSQYRAFLDWQRNNKFINPYYYQKSSKFFNTQQLLNFDPAEHLKTDNFSNYINAIPFQNENALTISATPQANVIIGFMNEATKILNGFQQQNIIQNELFSQQQKQINQQQNLIEKLCNKFIINDDEYDQEVEKINAVNVSNDIEPDDFLTTKEHQFNEYYNEQQFNDTKNENESLEKFNNVENQITEKISINEENTKHLEDKINYLDLVNDLKNFFTTEIKSIAEDFKNEKIKSDAEKQKIFDDLQVIDDKKTKFKSLIDKELEDDELLEQTKLDPSKRFWETLVGKSKFGFYNNKVWNWLGYFDHQARWIKYEKDEDFPKYPSVHVYVLATNKKDKLFWKKLIDNNSYGHRENGVWIWDGVFDQNYNWIPDPTIKKINVQNIKLNESSNNDIYSSEYAKYIGNEYYGYYDANGNWVWTGKFVNDKKFIPNVRNEVISDKPIITFDYENDLNKLNQSIKIVADNLITQDNESINKTKIHDQAKTNVSKVKTTSIYDDKNNTYETIEKVLKDSSNLNSNKKIKSESTIETIPINYENELIDSNVEQKNVHHDQEKNGTQQFITLKQESNSKQNFTYDNVIKTDEIKKNSKDNYQVISIDDNHNNHNNKNKNDWTSKFNYLDSFEHKMIDFDKNFENINSEIDHVDKSEEIKNKEAEQKLESSGESLSKNNSETDHVDKSEEIKNKEAEQKLEGSGESLPENNSEIDHVDKFEEIKNKETEQKQEDDEYWKQFVGVDGYGHYDENGEWIWAGYFEEDNTWVPDPDYVNPHKLKSEEIKNKEAEQKLESSGESLSKNNSEIDHVDKSEEIKNKEAEQKLEGSGESLYKNNSEIDHVDKSEEIKNKETEQKQEDDEYWKQFVGVDGYGHYDENGEWIWAGYFEEDNTWVPDPDYVNPYEDEVSVAIDGTNCILADKDGNIDFEKYVGNENFGYYDENKEWQWYDGEFNENGDWLVYQVDENEQGFFDPEHWLDV